MAESTVICREVMSESKIIENARVKYERKNIARA
jgi:hypothetical protein